MKNNTQDVVGYRISQLDRPFDLKPNQATSRLILAIAIVFAFLINHRTYLDVLSCSRLT